MPTITTDRLHIAYAAHGPADGQPVLLLHGWPDDASTWDVVIPALVAAGLRLIVPTLRGFGDTRFVSEATPRTGNSAIHAMDAIALMDALGIDRFMVAGHDWGSNIAEALAVVHRGAVVEQGTVDDLVERPQHEYTRHLLAAHGESTVHEVAS